MLLYTQMIALTRPELATRLDEIIIIPQWTTNVKRKLDKSRASHTRTRMIRVTRSPVCPAGAVSVDVTRVDVGIISYKILIT